MIVRPAALNDIPDIVRMGQEFASYPGYEGQVRLEQDVFAERLHSLAVASDGCLWVLDDGGAVHGAIGGFAAPSLFSSARHAAELFWFVDEAYRGNGGGRLLLNAIIAWAKHMDVVSLNMIEPPGSPEIGALYERQGFKKFETYWNLNVSD